MGNVRVTQIYTLKPNILWKKNKIEYTKRVIRSCKWKDGQTTQRPKEKGQKDKQRSSMEASVGVHKFYYHILCKANADYPWFNDSPVKVPETKV